MSFRGRLRLFFALIVIVPMTALGVVIFALTERTETGKADAGLGTAARTALALHRDQLNAARPAVKRVAADSRLQLAIVRGRIGAARRRMRALVRGDVIAIELWSRPGRRLAQVGSDAAVAWRGSELVRRGGGSSATLFLSVTHAGALARRIEHLTELEVAVFRGRRRLASTLPRAGNLEAPPPEGSADIDVAGHSYRGRGVRFNELAGPPVDLAILRPAAPLAAKIDEVERKRQELEETIRRVGDALATGLDRHGLVALAVRQAVDACEGEVGRALPLARGAFAPAAVGPVTGELEQVIEAAERHVFVVRPDVGPELLGALEGDETAQRTRRAVSAQAGGAHALSIGLRSLVDGPEYLGAISIARHGDPFTREEEELLEYLAGQAVVSIENASLHETVERQAVTDELTGLANLRALGSILNRELERSRRFENPLAFVMLDIDDFKQVNDTHGHQQGDEVLAHVASVLRALSRDIDAPARYGGEELAVVVPGTDVDGAMLLAERMREAIERLRVPGVAGGESLKITASFGVAAIPESARDREGLIAAADA